MKKYENPMIELVIFQACDIVTISVGDGQGSAHEMNWGEGTDLSLNV